MVGKQPPPSASTSSRGEEGVSDGPLELPAWPGLVLGEALLPLGRMRIVQRGGF